MEKVAFEGGEIILSEGEKWGSPVAEAGEVERWRLL